MEEVKKTYRKLALRYHPDINPDPKANERFVLIKKAYEVILEADKHSDYWHNEIKTKRDPARNREQRPSREEAIKVGRERQRRYEAMRIRKEAQRFVRFKKSIYYPWTMGMAYVSLIMFVLIFLDAFWVSRTAHGFVTQKEQIVTEFLGVKTSSGFRFHFGNGETLDLPNETSSLISEGTHISFAESMIFHDIPHIYKVDQNFSETKIDAFNKPPHLFFLLFIAVPILIFFVDKPSAVFYSAGAFARYAVFVFILSYILL